MLKLRLKKTTLKSWDVSLKYSLLFIIKVVNCFPQRERLSVLKRSKFFLVIFRILNNSGIAWQICYDWLAPTRICMLPSTPNILFCIIALRISTGGNFTKLNQHCVQPTQHVSVIINNTSKIEDWFLGSQLKFCTVLWRSIFSNTFLLLKSTFQEIVLLLLEYKLRCCFLLLTFYSYFWLH